MSVFIQIFLVSSVRRFYFGRSRSSKVTDIGANRKRVCDFLLVRNSNFGPILHRFWAGTRFMCYLPHPYSTLILGVFPLTRSPMLGLSQSRGPKLFDREIIFEEFQAMCCWYLNVTDRQKTGRQTDGRLTLALPRSALASRGKNKTKKLDRPGMKLCYSRLNDNVGRSASESSGTWQTTTKSSERYTCFMYPRQTTQQNMIV